MIDRTLHRFWIEFEGRGLGFGVTAIDLDDALRLLGGLDPHLRPTTPVARVVQDVDVSTLDPGHVLGGIDPPTWRGVWFPRGVNPSSDIGVRQAISAAPHRRTVRSD